MAIRFLTSGESHGKCLNAIIEGIPYGYELDIDFINKELSSRQKGFGRGGRMKIEKDEIIIKSGLRHAITTGSPIALEIENKDWKNWVYSMSPEKIDFSVFDEIKIQEIKREIEDKKITKFRPAHADLAAALKYDFCDIRYSLERSSARETAIRVAVGAICQNILKNYNINFSFEILSVGGCFDKEKFEERIIKAQKEETSVGGEIKIVIKNVPVGLGSFTHWDKRLDGLLAGALMSIPAIKAVDIGLGREYSRQTGLKSHDEIFYDNKYYHKTNNSGGIEGGVSNGEDIILNIAMKPIPTLRKPLNSIEMKTHKKTTAHYERADSCAIDACGVVGVNMCAIVLLDAFLEKFTHDSKRDIDLAFKNYLKRLNEL